MVKQVSGGCACGRIRYRVTVADSDAYLCHCRMCQRATGGVSVPFKSVRKEDIVWEEEPDWYPSSPIAQRPFCRTCGTSLGFAYPDSENMDLTVGSFDDPRPYRPRQHFGVESMHKAWINTDGLPESRTEAYQPVVDRWMEKVGKLPD
ncbi:GFA family protein [Sphingosinicella sp. CPCC 101087]|uniref:GFA family protein n=1 Tax=Sphingosinicella sp. CPCC 101087 TaxID=2497754 RepID=UPI00101C2C0F|nr:GFA family protein [Sphingosinicella sp. CPCC 101087]